MDRRLTSVDPENRIRMVAHKNKDKSQKTGVYWSKYKKKWRRLSEKNGDETVIY
jgi:hypothetical protein